MSFGLDPELFVVRKGASKATSIHLLPNFKPQKSKDATNPIWAHSKTDGFAFELTNDPSSCREYIVPALGNGIQDFLAKYPDYTLKAKAMMDLTVKSTKGETPEGVCNYGCVPDRSAFTLLEKTPPTDSYHNQSRYIGGHIHFGFRGFPQFSNYPNPGRIAPDGRDTQDEVWREAVAAAATLWWDSRVAVPMVAMLGNVNNYGEAERRTYYGQAGSHRVKDYGVEYRVLSGAIMLSPFLLTWAMGAIRHASKQNKVQQVTGIGFEEGTGYVPLSSASSIHDRVGEWFNDKRMDLDGVRSIIDSHDVEGAREYVKNNLKGYTYLPNFISTMLTADSKGIGLPTNIQQAWRTKAEIVNHMYPGCEKLMRPEFEIFKAQFPALDLIELAPRGWR